MMLRMTNYRIGLHRTTLDHVWPCMSANERS